MLVQNQEELGEGLAILTDPYHTPTITPSSTSQPQKTQKPRKPKRKGIQVPQPSGPTNIVADEAVHKELGDRLVRAATTASSLEAEQDSGNITKTRSKATPNESSSLGTLQSENVLCGYFDWMRCLQNKNAAKGDVNNEQIYQYNTANAPTKISIATTTTATIPIPRKGIVSTELGTPTITRSSQQPSHVKVQDKGKGKMVEPEPVKPTKKKVQIMLNEDIALKLQAEIYEEKRIVRAEEENIDEANIA
ncbi:hypothetical protein Tco_0754249 [Tanacetum coccineum]